MLRRSSLGSWGWRLGIVWSNSACVLLKFRMDLTKWRLLQPRCSREDWHTIDGSHMQEARRPLGDLCGSSLRAWCGMVGGQAYQEKVDRCGTKHVARARSHGGSAIK